MMDGKTVQNMYSVIKNKIKFEKLVHIVGLTIEIYSNARPYERQDRNVMIKFWFQLNAP